jgi:hypothetical protein
LLSVYAVDLQSDHQKITAAGWPCRTNGRGWAIYRQPNTGRWFTRADAVRQITLSPKRRPLFRRTAASVHLPIVTHVTEPS